MRHSGALFACQFAFLSVFCVEQAQAANLSPPAYGSAAHFRIVQTQDGTSIKQPLQVLPDGQQRYIIELEGPTVLEQVEQLQPLQRPQTGTLHTTTIAAPVLMQLNRQVQTEQQQVLSQLQQSDLIGETFANTQVLINTVVVAAKPADLVKIAALPGVKKIQLDRELQLHLDKSVPLIGADLVWKKTNSQSQLLLGTGIRIGVIDTGIDYTHPDLGGCFGDGCKVAGGYDFYDNDADPIDTDSHGTHVAGIIAANGKVKGVAPEATLYAYRVCAQYCPTSYIIQALERAADPDQNPLTQDALDVVNLSLGGPGDLNDLSTIAANNAARAGIVVVISAGNDGKKPNAVGSPGNAELAITVAASNQNDQMADFSSRGPSVSDVIFKPDVAAPGEFINSTIPNNRHGYNSGTSMAAPHVAGAAALLKQQQKNRTPAEIKSLLVNSAKNLQQPLPAQGSGRLDVLAAADATLTFSPQSISFGKLDNKALWVQQKAVVIHNTAATNSTIRLERPTLPAGVTLTITPEQIIGLPAGGSQEVQLQLTVDPTIYQMPTNGNVVEDVSLNIRNEQANYRLAIAFLAYHAVEIDSTDYINQLQIYDEAGNRYSNSSAWGGMGLRMPTGTFDFIASYTMGAKQRIVVKEQQRIQQQQRLTIDPATAIHEIYLESVSDRDGSPVPLESLIGGVHALEIRHQSKPVYFLQMNGLLGDNSWGTTSGPQLTQGQSLLISPFSDKFQLAVAAYWQDTRAEPDDIQLYSWSQRYTGMSSGETIRLDAKNQNRLLTQVGAAPFAQNLSFSYSIIRDLTGYNLAREDRSGIVGYGNRLASVAANQSATLSIYGTAASSIPYYGVGLFEVSVDANDYKNTVSGNNWRFNGQQGISKFSTTNHLGLELDKPITYDLNPQGRQYLTHLPHWPNFYSYIEAGTATLTVRAHTLRDIYGNYLHHQNSAENPVQYQSLLRCDHSPGSKQQANEYAFTFDNVCKRYDVELEYSTGLLDQQATSFSRLTLLEENRYQDLSLGQVRLGYDNQPSQLISQGTGFFELSGDKIDAVSAEIHYQGQWRPLSMQLTTPNAQSLPVFRGEFTLPDTAALASVRYIVKNNNGNSLESVFHNAAIIGPKPDTALLLDNDKDGLPDHQDPDDDNDGISDIDELRYRLDLYKDDRQGDLDNDGLSNLQELALMTFPHQADTDTDGIADGFEQQYGLKPLDKTDALLDLDQDGLTNLQEFSARTNPTKADTDGDTLPDGWEVQYGLNALDAANAKSDPDQDGLDNLAELQQKTNPVKADTDNDGLPDGWEIKYNLNPLDSADAASDRDNDGATALQEFSRNTDPTVANQIDKPTPVESGSSGGGSFGWSGLLLLIVSGWRRRFTSGLVKRV